MTGVGVPVAVAAKVTVASHWPGVLLARISAGQVICGPLPVTVTVNEHSAIFPEASVTLWVTMVAPIGNVDPLARPAVLVVTDEGQLSVPTGAV